MARSCPCTQQWATPKAMASSTNISWIVFLRTWKTMMDSRSGICSILWVDRPHNLSQGSVDSALGDASKGRSRTKQNKQCRRQVSRSVVWSDFVGGAWRVVGLSVHGWEEKLQWSVFCHWPGLTFILPWSSCHMVHFEVPGTKGKGKSNLDICVRSVSLKMSMFLRGVKP